MITFAKFYKTQLVDEVTRRDFLKKTMSAVAGTIAAPNVAQTPATAAAAVVKQHRPGFPIFTYDVNDAVNLPNIKLMLSMMHDDNPLPMQQINAKADKIFKQFTSIDLDNNPIMKHSATLKKLIATSEETRQLFVNSYVSNARKMLKSKMSHKDMYMYSNDTFVELELYADRMFSNLLVKLLKHQDGDLFNYLTPLDVYYGDELVMDADEALKKHIFKATYEDVAKNFVNNVDVKKAVDDVAKNVQRQIARKKKDEIEYSPADYKGGWENDPDTQPLSWESIVAEKNIHDAVRPGILKRQVKGKMTCSKARSLKSKQKNKGNNTAKAAQRYLNYHC